MCSMPHPSAAADRPKGNVDMLISHEHRFIFVKTKKSAGSSIEATLARFCDGPLDVVTRLARHDQRFEGAAGVRPKNYRGELEGVRYSGHMSAVKIRERVGEEIWNSYSTFCFVRNPWSRAVSQYCFRRATRENQPSSFEQFVREERFTVELPLYYGHGEVLVDHVLRFEELEKELRRITRLLGLEWDGWLPHANAGFSPAGRHYSEAYTLELTDIVARKCGAEIALHGYRFEGQPHAEGEAMEPWTGKEKGRAGDEKGAAGDEVAFPGGSDPDVNVVADNNCRPRRCNGISEETRTGGLALRRSDDTAFALTHFDHEVWPLCDGQNTVADICQIIKDKNGTGDSELSTDLLVALHRFEQRGLIDAPGLLDIASKGRRCVDLRRLKFYVINCEDDARRRAFMEGQLRERGLDFEFIAGLRCKPSRVGVALSHLKILAMREVVTPFAILEDDCQFTEALEYQYDLPAETDALYLGVSHFGSRRPGVLSRSKWNNVRFVQFEDDYLRVFNMYARHAIVFLSEAFRQSAASASIRGLTQRGRIFPGDACYAMLHSSHLVLTPNEPACYQSRAFGGAEGATKRPLHVSEKSQR